MKLVVLFGEGNLKLREKRGGWGVYILFSVWVWRLRKNSVKLPNNSWWPWWCWCPCRWWIAWLHGWMVFVVVRWISHLPSFPSILTFTFFSFFLSFIFSTPHFSTSSSFYLHIFSKINILSFFYTTLGR